MLPIDRPPIADGWIEYADGRIISMGATGAGRPPGPVEDLGDVAVMPGLVNAHTHLELSGLEGRVPAAASMVEWIRTLMAARGAAARPGAADIEPMTRAVAAMHAAGTALVGDITNGSITAPAIEAFGLGGVVFHELLGFNVADPHAVVRDAWARVEAADHLHREAAAGTTRVATAPGCRYSVVAHAPYSVSPALFAEIGRAWREAPLSVHLAESIEEIEFLHTGRGPFRELLEHLGVWDGRWQPPAGGPVEYLRRLGYLHPGCLVVHGVHLTAKDRALLRDLDTVLVTCPRSNAWVGAGLPPITRFYDDGLRVAIGTDSLASVGSLSMFDELAEVRRIAPEVDAARLLESATKIGAEALGFPEFGSLRPGQHAAFAVVDVPADVTDVEEYLVSGVPAAAVGAM
jgi:aminodeoxyfutalosine deaminase